MSAPRKKLKKRSVEDAPAPTDTTTAAKLSEYDLKHIFYYLSFLDKARAAQVCRRWKSTVNQVSLWRGSDEDIKETADMEIMAPSLVKRGITQVFISDANSEKAKNGRFNTHSLLFLDQQLCHVTKIMAASLTTLDLFHVVRPVGFRVLQRLLSVSMPNLKSLSLGENIQIRMETLKNIVLNCSNLSNLMMCNCKNVGNEGIELVGMKLKKLYSLTMERSQHLTDAGFESLS